MLEQLGDMWWEWKHALSSDNSAGTRGLFIGLTIVIILCLLSSIASVVFGIILKKALFFAIAGLLLVFAIGIPAFIFISDRRNN